MAKAGEKHKYLFPDDVVDYFEKAFKSKSLSGSLSISGGGVVPGVRVILMDKKWNKVLDQTVADENGHFTFGDKYKKGKYYLEFSKEGFHHLRIKIKLTSKQNSPNEVRLVMHVS